MHRERKHRIADAANQSHVDALGIPLEDRFITITGHGPGELHTHPTFMGMQRSHDPVTVDFLLGAHRPSDQKKKLFSTLSALLHEKADIRPDDLFVAILPVPNENFSFGRGIAKLADQRLRCHSSVLVLRTIWSHFPCYSRGALLPRLGWQHIDEKAVPGAKNQQQAGVSNY